MLPLDAHKASRKLGEVNRGQAALRAVKQLCVWLKTTLSSSINIPTCSWRAFKPHCFTGRHDGPGGSRQVGQDGGRGNRFMTCQKFGKLYQHGDSEERYCGGILYFLVNIEIKHDTTWVKCVIISVIFYNIVLIKVIANLWGTWQHSYTSLRTNFITKVARKCDVGKCTAKTLCQH